MAKLASRAFTALSGRYEVVTSKANASKHITIEPDN